MRTLLAMGVVGILSTCFGVPPNPPVTVALTVPVGTNRTTTSSVGYLGTGSRPIPSEVTNLVGYTMGMPYQYDIVGGVTNNYRLVLAAAPAITPRKVNRKMEFTISFYDELTRAPIGEIKAIHSGTQGFMKTTDMQPITE
jgi:hypothetical protein